MELSEAKTAIDEYRDLHRPKGGFLTAVLENDLKGALNRADPTSLENLHAIVKYCWNELPTQAWGSEAAVKAWLAARPRPPERREPADDGGYLDREQSKEADRMNQRGKDKG